MKKRFNAKKEAGILQNNLRKFLANGPLTSIMKKNIGDFKQPLSDITHSAKKVIINIGLPDIKQKEVELRITKRYIEVKAEKKQRKVKRKKDFYQEIKSSKGFYRMIKLPPGLNYNRAKAIFKKSHLRIEIPREK